MKRWDAQLSDETLRQLRDENDDTSLTKSPTLCTLFRRIDDIFERDDILYIHDDNTDKIIFPRSKHDTSLKELHAQPFAEHLGVNRTLSAIRSRYYWPALASIVANYVKQCRDCATFKRATVNTTPPLKAIPCSHPNELVEMDIVGPIIVSSKGNKYILIIVDAWNKWPEAYPIPNQETETISADMMYRKQFLPIKDVILKLNFSRDFVKALILLRKELQHSIHRQMDYVSV